MKRITLLAAVALMALSCNKTELDSTNPNNTASREVSVTASINDRETSAGSKVELTETENGNLTLNWESADKLGGWSSGLTTMSEFTLTNLSDDKKTADFSGTITSESYRLFYPYEAVGSKATISENILTLNLAWQEADMDEDGLGNTGDYTYLLSELLSAQETGDEVATSEEVAMKHLTAAINVQLRFSALDERITGISSIEFGGNSAAYGYTEGFFDLSKSTTAEDFYERNVYSSTYTSVSVLNCPTPKVYSEGDESTTYSIKFNLIPSEVLSGKAMLLKLYFTTESSGTLSKSFSVTNNGSDLTLGAGSYTTFNYLCDASTDLDAQYWTSYAAESYAGGSGSEGSPYLISTPEQLAKMAWEVNNQINQSAHFKLTNNIDLTGHNWESIGTTYLNYSSGQSVYRAFSGVFDGGGFEVSNLTVAQEQGSIAGLFGHTDNAIIKNTTVSGTIVGGSGTANMNAAGGIVAYADNTKILYCCNKAAVSGSVYVGGIVGYRFASDGFNASIISCSNSGEITNTTDTYKTERLIGGIVGSASYVAYTEIVGCYNSGTITYNSANAAGGYSGGIAGRLDRTYTSSGTTSSTATNLQYGYNSGTVTGGYGLSGTFNTSSDSYELLMAYSYYMEGSTSYNKASSYLGYTDLAYNNVSSLSSDFMKSADFLSSLNSFSASYNATDPTYPACAWVAGTDGLPVHNYTNFSPSGENLIPVVETLKYNLETGNYEVYNSQGLLELAAMVNSGGTVSTSISVLQMADIDLSEVCGTELGSWTLIGNSSSANFRGSTYDGNGYTISNLYVNSSGTYAGLFGYANNSSTLKNIILIDPNITCTNTTYNSGKTGAIVGATSKVSIIACGVIGGSVTGASMRVGGVVGEAASGTVITSCYSTTSVYNSGSYITGGMIGCDLLTSNACTVTTSYWVNSNSDDDATYDLGYTASGASSSTPTGNYFCTELSTNAALNGSEVIEAMNGSLSGNNFQFVASSDTSNPPMLEAVASDNP